VEHSKRSAERPQNGRAPLRETRATPGQSDGFILLTLQEHRQQSALREGGSHFSHGILFLFGDCNARVMIGSPQLFRLLRWTFHRAVRTKNAAIAQLRLQHGFAVRALVKELASISRHYFFFGKTALRTGDDGLG
jgi:hypothetical protein